MTMPWAPGQVVVPTAEKWNNPTLDNPPSGIKVWMNGAWTLKPCRVWDGSSWVIKPLKYWNGAAWVEAGW